MYSLKSTFIETPTKPMVDLSLDFVKNPYEDVLRIYSHSLTGIPSKVRIRIKLYADMVEKLDIPRIERNFKDQDAELTLELIRMPRENVRS